ncbi:MAG: site-2 protease family protein [Candidatus Cloacimonetes bacterium]|nr:site-2 protease family protein [Candidatus Cloacimonadota bacterium]
MDLVLLFLKKIFWFIILVDGVALFFALGKYLVSKFLNIKLTKIKIGVGSSILLSKSFGEVLFVICSFPVGGSLEFSPKCSNDPQVVNSEISPLKKLILICAGPISSIFFTFVVLGFTFYMFGDTPSTMQVTNTIPGMPAHKSGFQRGDIILKVNNEDIKRFDEGRQSISKLVQTKVSFTIERKGDYLVFDNYEKAKTYLTKTYQHKSYIKIFQKGVESYLMFYAKEPAIRHLRSMNPNNIEVHFSQSSKILNIDVLSTNEGKVGIGIKPYSLNEKSLELGLAKSFKTAFDFTHILSKEFLTQAFSMIHSFLKKRELPVNVPWELKQFIEEFSEMTAFDFFRLFAMVSLTIGWLSFFPIPKLAGGKVFVMFLRMFINKLALLFNYKEEPISLESEIWLDWFYLIAFVFLILLMIFQNMLVIAQL